MTRPRVATVLRTGDTNYWATTNDLVNLACHDRFFAGFMGENGHAVLPNAFNNTVAALQGLTPSITHVMYVDSDMRFPNDTITRLLAHDKPIVGATYRRRQPPHELMVWDLDGKMDETLHTGLRRVGAIPSGLSLVSMRVFRALGYPWYYSVMGAKPADFISPDLVLCQAAKDAGFEIWCDYDLSRQVRHAAMVELPFEWGKP